MVLNPESSLRPLAVLATLSFAALAVSAQPRYFVTDLGRLPGSDACWATGLNDRGDVVGYCAPAAENFNQTGFVWRNGTMTRTGLLPDGNYSIATSINNVGTVVGDGDTGNFRPQSWVLKDGKLVKFFPNNGGNTHALFVADAGWIGGYYTKSLSGWTSSWKGAIWTQDQKDPRKWRLTDLPVLPGGIDPKSSSSIPWAFNQRGQAAGYASNDQIGQHAALWNADAARSIVDLGVFPGDWSSLANGISDLGHVVGSSHPPFGSRPVLWNIDAARTPIELPVLPGDNQGSATAVNKLVQVLGSSWYGTPGTWDRTEGRTVLWRDGAVYPLQELLDPLTGGGCTVRAATAINNVGQITAAAVCDGSLRAVLLTPLS